MRRRGLRVLLVTDWVPHEGGVETYLLMLRDALRAAGDDVRLVTSGAGSAADGTADYVAFGTERKAAQAFLQIANPSAALTVRRAVREFRPDVVHVSMFEMFLSPAIFAVLRGLPTVLSIPYYKLICPIGLKLLPDGERCTVRPGLVCVRSGCVGPAHWLRDRPRYALLRRAVASAARIVTCSRWMAAELARHDVRAEALSWPVAPVGPGFTRRQAPEPVFVYLGRLSREKGVELLLHAFARVRVELPDARLRIVGDGPDRRRIESLRRTLGIESSVELVGRVGPERLDELLTDAWALAAPSLWAEPFGQAAAEAIVRGVPVVATAGGGFDETVEPGVSGLLVEPEASALAAGLLRAPAAVSPEAVAAARQRHDLGTHVDALRRVLASID